MMDWLLLIPWAALYTVWAVAAPRGKRTARSEPARSRLVHLGALTLAFALLAAPLWGGSLLPWPIFPALGGAFWLGLGLACAGIGFAIWARAYLGRNWSGNVALKAGQDLVRTGPYALVRHPIYSGVTLGFVGTAIAQNRLTGLAAAVIVIVAYARKIGIEERWLVEGFGAAYAEYKQSVKALIPFLY